MILLDWRGFALPLIFGNTKYINGLEEFNPTAFEESVLMSLAYYNNRFKREYGELIICADGNRKKYWRSSVFPHYKMNRNYKQEDTFNDPEVAQFMRDFPNRFAQIIKTHFPFVVIALPFCEADDIIATLVKAHPNDKHLILAGDGDFKQLHTGTVSQYSTVKDKFVQLKETKNEWLLHKLVYGDAKDGIPNIFSDADKFVNEEADSERMSKKKFDTFINRLHNPDDEFKASEELKRFRQNRQLIDFAQIPDHVTKDILKEFNSYVRLKNDIVLTSVIKLKYLKLMDRIDELKTTTIKKETNELGF